MVYENPDEEAVAMVEESPSYTGMTLNLLGMCFFFFYSLIVLSVFSVCNSGFWISYICLI